MAKRVLARWVVGGLVVFGLAGWEPRVAQAQTRRWVSVTNSPLHLILPMVEMTGEVRLTRWKRPLAMAGIVGFGSLKDTIYDGTADEREVRGKVYELGAQALFYPLSDFDSLQLGAEFIWLTIDAELEDSSVSGAAAGTALGPFVGYKFMANIGFTFVAQLGFEAVIMRADAEDSATGQRTSDSGKGIIPLLNLNLGWSF